MNADDRSRLDELDWARHGQAYAEVTELKTTGNDAARILGWTFVLLAFVPPIAVILWRLATLAWS